MVDIFSVQLRAAQSKIGKICEVSLCYNNLSNTENLLALKIGIRTWVRTLTSYSDGTYLTILTTSRNTSFLPIRHKILIYFKLEKYRSKRYFTAGEQTAFPLQLTRVKWDIETHRHTHTCTSAQRQTPTCITHTHTHTHTPARDRFFIQQEEWRFYIIDCQTGNPPLFD